MFILSTAVALPRLERRDIGITEAQSPVLHFKHLKNGPQHVAGNTRFPKQVFILIEGTRLQ